MFVEYIYKNRIENLTFNISLSAKIVMLMHKPLQSQPMQSYLSYPIVENALTLVCFIGGEPLNLVDAENLEY